MPAPAPDQTEIDPRQCPLCGQPNRCANEVERETGVPVRELDLYAALAQIAPRPILFVHGVDDTVVPAKNSEKMFAAASPPKELFLIPGAGHSDLFEPDPAAYEHRLLTFLDAAFAP